MTEIAAPSMGDLLGADTPSNWGQVGDPTTRWAR